MWGAIRMALFTQFRWVKIAFLTLTLATLAGGMYLGKQALERWEKAVSEAALAKAEVESLRGSLERAILATEQEVAMRKAVEKAWEEREAAWDENRQAAEVRERVIYLPYTPEEGEDEKIAPMQCMDVAVLDSVLGVLLDYARASNASRNP